jgi:hypothetical protein
MYPFKMVIFHRFFLMFTRPGTFPLWKALPRHWLAVAAGQDPQGSAAKWSPKSWKTPLEQGEERGWREHGII